MFESLISALQFFVSLVGGTAAATDPGASSLAIAVAVVFAVVALAAVRSAAPLVGGQANGPHPRRAIDESSPLTQSDPDAAGHPRPRAPQSAASAA